MINVWSMCVYDLSSFLNHCFTSEPDEYWHCHLGIWKKREIQSILKEKIYSLGTWRYWTWQLKQPQIIILPQACKVGVSRVTGLIRDIMTLFSLIHGPIFMLRSKSTSPPTSSLISAFLENRGQKSQENTVKFNAFICFSQFHHPYHLAEIKQRQQIVLSTLNLVLLCLCMSVCWKRKKKNCNEIFGRAWVSSPSKFATQVFLEDDVLLSRSCYCDTLMSCP